ncbi:hypothetical protein [Pseudanabaena mucicola]|uniref:DUF1254 domain-containing protein n=1 Tax=Pseudanabaena mucicola FACHB-723 TaxID=2692860 RepID=A0ABR7ZW11_9CYAN|nr:hypothetical protein [Pseudanabaena mucicola]MBD2188156.1 hypothetical protein [Pseudanabaena mucicola FACHB-723]
MGTPNKSHQGVFRKLFQLAVVLIAIPVLWISWLAWQIISTNQASTSPDNADVVCSNSLHTVNNTQIYKSHPRKIIIEPWLGQHHVYALFVVPKKYLIGGEPYPAVVEVKGSTKLVSITGAKPSLYAGIDVPPDHTLVVSFFWTREVVWQILQGKYGELRQPCNWTLYIKVLS